MRKANWLGKEFRLMLIFIMSPSITALSGKIYTTVQNLRSVRLFLKKLKLLFRKDTINWWKITVKTCIMQQMSILNKYCAFKLSFHQIFQKNTYHLTSEDLEYRAQVIEKHLCYFYGAIVLHGGKKWIHVWKVWMNGVNYSFNAPCSNVFETPASPAWKPIVLTLTYTHTTTL